MNKTPSTETKGTLDTLNAELQQIMAMLGADTDIEQPKKDQAYARISDLTGQIVNISKSGDAPVYIINLNKKRWVINRGYSSFWISGKVPDQEYAVTEITGRPAPYDTGRGGEADSRSHGWRLKFDTLYYTAASIAADIVREINGDLPAMVSTRQGTTERIVKTMGAFASPTRIPSRELLAKCRDTFHKYCAALVAEGNSVWDRTKDYRQISDLYRDAAEELGISTVWHENLLDRQTCPGCGDSVRKNIAIHPTCGAILDRAKANSLGLIVGQQVQQRR